MRIFMGLGQIMDKSILEDIQNKLHYKFRNVQLLVQAFTHSSYANANNVADNERMEFFGDALLDMFVSEYYYNKYPNCDQGKLTNLRRLVVSQDGLRPVVQQMQIMQYLQVSQKQKSGKIESNLYEAVLCAIYLDGGINVAKKFVIDTLSHSLDSTNVNMLKDNKTFVQEFLQDLPNKPVPNYVTKRDGGRDDNPLYVSRLFVDGSLVGKGAGTSKKTAEQNAAGEYRKHLEK